MVGMENGIFPGTASLTNYLEMEESRRLAYVGITRAKEQLYMTSAQNRRVFGRSASYAESDFIMEIPKELKEIVNPFGAVKNINSNFNGKTNTYKANVFSTFTSRSTDEIVKKSNVVFDEPKLLEEKEATVGRKVKHPKFGVGTIVSITNKEGNTHLTIAFQNMGIKTFRIDMAPLQLI
jgi:DNA helicase-2/ATP-dependent DNA helicase PcrA